MYHVVAAIACFTLVLGAALPVTAEQVRVSFAEQANRHGVSGFGGEWDPHFWREQNTRRGCDEAAWQQVTKKIRDMGIGRVRTMILPDWYEPDNDNDDPNQTDWTAFTWDTEPMRSLYRHLDFCQEAGIRVTLTWWCAPVKRQGDGQPYWLAYPDVKQWCSAPNDAAECVENVVAGLQYLIDQRGYTCIDAFTFVNEPDWTYFNNDNKVEFEPYAAICRGIHERLKAAGLRDRLTLDLADASVHRGWLRKSVAGLQGVADKYNSHSYIFSCEDEGYPAAIRGWIAERVQICGDAPFSTNELGTRHYEGAYTAKDVEAFERAFCVAQYALLGLNEGMTGALFWGLYDQYYYDGDDPDDGSNGGRMKTNLMAYLDEDWRVRPTGLVWTLVCHGAPRGAKVHCGDSSDPNLDAVALAVPGGGVNVLLVNRDKAPREVALSQLPAKVRADNACQVRAFTRDGLGTTEAADGGAITAPAESFLLLTFGGEK